MKSKANPIVDKLVKLEDFGAKEIGEVLVFARTKRKLSAHTVSASLGFSHSWLYMIEKGKTNVKVVDLLGVLNTYNIRLDHFIDALTARRQRPPAAIPRATRSDAGQPRMERSRIAALEHKMDRLLNALGEKTGVQTEAPSEHS